MAELLPWHQAPVHHIALKVRDLAAAEAFYHGLLQLPIQARHHDDAGAPRSIWLSLGGKTILMLEKAPYPSEPGGWHLIALQITAAQRQTTEAALERLGIAITGRTAYSIYVQDPEGNRLAFSSWPTGAASAAPSA